MRGIVLVYRLSELMGKSFLTDVASGDVDAVRGWIAGGIDVNATACDGLTALMVAASKTRSLARNRLRIANILIENGANVNATSHMGWTALSVASAESEEEMTLLLIANCANVNAADDFGVTPLMSCAEQGQIKAVKEIVAYGADTNPRNAAGMSALDLARSNNQAAVAEFLESMRV